MPPDLSADLEPTEVDHTILKPDSGASCASIITGQTKKPARCFTYRQDTILIAAAEKTGW